MKKIIYITGILSVCCFILSGAFKILQLMGAPLLLMSSAVFGCLFVILFSVSKFREKYVHPSESEKINKAVEDFEKKIVLGRDHKYLLNNLEELRKKAGLTQQELSESAGDFKKEYQRYRKWDICPLNSSGIKNFNNVKL